MTKVVADGEWKRDIKLYNMKNARMHSAKNQ